MSEQNNLPVLDVAPRVPLQLQTSLKEQAAAAFRRHYGSHVMPGMVRGFCRYGTAEERASGLESGSDDTPAGGDIQPWVLMADFSVHPNTPHLPGGQYGIYGRITAAGELDFAIRRAEVEDAAPAGGLRLAVDIAAPEYAARPDHGVGHEYPLRLASKEQAAQVMLDAAGKMKASAAPKYLGHLMAGGKFRFRAGRAYGQRNFYNHIWAYWGAWVDGLLCIVGFPVWVGSEHGGLEYGTNEAPEVAVGAIPPTAANRPGGALAGDFAAACTQFMRGGVADADIPAMWAAWGGGQGGTVILRRAVAVAAGGVSPLQRGDIAADGDLYAPAGGWQLMQGGKLRLLDPATAEDAVIRGDWEPESGAETGYLPYYTHAGNMGAAARWLVYLAAEVWRWGKLLRIRFCGNARMAKSYLSGGGDVELSIGGENDDPPPGIPPDGGDDDPDYPPVNPTPPGPTPPPVPPLPWPFPPPAGAVWWESGNGFRRTGVRRVGGNGVVQYEFDFEVSTRKIRAKGSKGALIELTAHAADGGSYIIAPPPAVLQMYYGFNALSHNFSVVNKSSKQHSGSTWVPVAHPPSEHTAERSTWLHWVAIPSYGKMTLHSNGRPPQSDLYRCINTGRTHRVQARVVDPATGKSAVWVGYFPVWRIELVETAVVKAMTAAAERGMNAAVHGNSALAGGGAYVTPASIRGESDSLAGPPVVRAGQVQTSMPGNFAPSTYQPAGALPLWATVTYSWEPVSFAVEGQMSGWSEVTWERRASASISGEFTVQPRAVRKVLQCSAP